MIPSLWKPMCIILRILTCYAVRKTITLTARACQIYKVCGWRQSAHNIKRIKKLYRKAQQLKRSTPKDAKNKLQRATVLMDIHRSYLDLAGSFFDRVSKTLVALRDQYVVPENVLAEIQSFMAHGQRQIEQIERRVIGGETIPYEEKVFSVFEDYTEWICKGKAGVPVELGLKGCILEGPYGFILNHQVMQKQTDEEVAVSIVEETQKKFPQLK